MMQNNWWNVYGSFEPGEDDLPHMGQVIAHYRKLSGLKTIEAAQKLTEMGWDKIGERRMEQLQSKSNVAEPQAISRRRMIARLLAIPPALMGLSAITEMALQPAKETTSREMLNQYESTLQSFWDSFYSSSVQRHAGGILLWRNHLQHLEEHEARYKPELQTMLCRFDQLAAVTARDKADYISAMYYHNESIELAEQLGNAELWAACLIRRAKTLIQQKKLNKGIDDLKLALKYARRCRDNLRGYVFQMTAQVITLMPVTNESPIQFQRFMGEASRILSKGVIESDSSFVQLNMTGYHQDRARGYLRLGNTGAAHDAIEAAEKVQQPDMTRWQAELLLLRAEAYAQENEVEWACHQVRTAAQLIDATQSQVQKKQLERFYQAIAEQHPNHPEVRQLGAFITA